MPDVTMTAAAKKAFDEAYRAYLDPARRALLDMDPNDPERAKKAKELMDAGAVIDLDTMVWGWDAYVTFVQRTVDDLPWVSSAAQPAIGLATPTGALPPFSPYDPNITHIENGVTKAGPPGSIPVSLNLADYPAFDPPAPPPPPADHNMVGSLNGLIYTAGPGAMLNGIPQVTDGQVLTQNGASYTAHVYRWPFGWGVYFTKN